MSEEGPQPAAMEMPCEACAGGIAKLRDCGLLVLLFALFPLLRPFQNAPFVDDAVYGWSVQWLMQHGQIRILEYSHINPVQIIWGWLFCLPGGFSFSALRFSNWVLGAATLCGLYLTLREFGASRKLSLAGAATLAVNPLFVILSCSFMTDVPLLAMVTWGTYALILAVRRQSDRWLWISAMLGAFACGIRIPGAVLPIATGCVLVLHTRRWGWRPDRLVAAVLPLVFLGALVVFQDRVTHPTVDISEMKNSMAGRMYLLGYALRFLPQVLLSGVLFIATMGGVCLLPLALGSIEAKRLRRAAVVLLILAALVGLAVAMGQRLFQPLSGGQTWELGELGATSDLVAGRVRPVYPAWVLPLVFWASLVSGAVVLAQSYWRRATQGESVLHWQMLGHFLLIAILWLTYDRYILPILPLLIVLTVVSLPRIRLAPYLCGGLVLLFGVSVAGLHDHLAYNRALWGAIGSLRGQGIAVSRIDAGYSANLWMHYAHPEDAPRDANGEPFVPHMTSHRSLQYHIANASMPGYEVVRTVPVSRWMGRDTSLYVLRQLPGVVLPDPDKVQEKW